MPMLPLFVLAALPLLCGAIPALPSSVAASTQQQQRTMQLEDFPDDSSRKNIDPAGSPPFAFQPSEQNAFVMNRLMNNQLPAAIIPKLTADAKIIPASGTDEWSQMGQQQKQKGRFVPPTDSMMPKMTGAVRSSGAEVAKRREKQPMAMGGANGGDALINPAAFFLQGADLDKIAAPSCHLMGCTGPLANDGDIALEGRTGPGAGGTRQCHQTFVPLNGCWERADGADSYPVGMVCTICCDCSAQLSAEMRRSRGWMNGYRTAQ